jgi:N4-gp56 family major capsid protein
MDQNTFKRNYRTANFTNEVTQTTGQGSSFTAYANAKPFWQGELSDAARMQMFFMDAVDVRQLPQKQYQYVVPFRKYYPLSSGVTFDTTTGVGVSTVGTITNYNTNLIDGKVITPLPYAAAAQVANYAEVHNIRDLLRDKMDELSYALSDKIDNAVAAGLSSSTDSTSTVAGATQIYGGTATSDYTLAAGSVLTPSLVNYAEVLLNGKTAYYWNSTTFTASSGTKNPWRNEPTDPFVLIVGQRQKQALRDSGQFVNAAQYGDRVVISSGEIGDYLGIRVIVSNNIPVNLANSAATAGFISGGGSGSVALDGGTNPVVDVARCFLIKGRAAYTFVWGRVPTFEQWEQGWTDSKGITLVCDFAGSVVHADAIVKIDVSQV